MRLTRFTDNALRCLLYLGVRPDDTATVPEIARQMRMSEDHLTKVVQHLAAKGYVRTIRGRKGGVRLAKLVDQIGIGQVVRDVEEDFAVVPCFEADHACPVTHVCQLAPAFDEAMQSFFGVLDRMTLGDLVREPSELLALSRARRDEPQRVSA